ncbi:MAG TPA: SpoIIE family protein phosphatase [Bryobacteraceae bacterium]|nr:SpoIIE family protein phosphatase [Bryobacteraceae bacterium]
MHEEADRIYKVIFEYAGRIGREQDKDALVAEVAGMARDLVGADRCSVWLLHPEGRELYTRFAHGVREIRHPIGLGLVGRCAETGEPSVVNSPATDPRFSDTVDCMTGYRTEAILTVPMRGADGQIIGACQVLNKPGGFAPADVDLISFAACFSAQAIENQQLQRERENAQRLRRELEIAREVQERLLPRLPVSIDNLDCAAVCQPALEVGGDYYNYWSLPGGKLAIAVGDVSGKGISAALLMASLQAWLYGLILRGSLDLPDLCSELNRIVYNSTAPDRYSSLFFALWDAATQTLQYVNAGQTAPLLYRPKANPGERIKRLTEGGLPIGLMPLVSYGQETIAFNQGDWLLCFSDGISEAMNPLEEEWGEDNMLAALEHSVGLTAETLVGNVLRAALDFTGTAPQHDDMTILAIRAREM